MNTRNRTTPMPQQGRGAVLDQRPVASLRPKAAKRKVRHFYYTKAARLAREMGVLEVRSACGLTWVELGETSATDVTKSPSNVDPDRDCLRCIKIAHAVAARRRREILEKMAGLVRELDDL